MITLMPDFFQTQSMVLRQTREQAPRRCGEAGRGKNILFMVVDVDLAP